MSRLPRTVRAPERATTSLLVRVPERGAAPLRLGMSCVVGEGQVAAFERDGRALDLLEAGRHTLSSRTVPNLARLDARRRASLEAAVYFVSRRVFSNWPWATSGTLRVVGRGGPLAVRAAGTFTFRIVEPRSFLEEEVEPRGLRDEEGVRKGLNEVILSRLADTLAAHPGGRSPSALRGELATHLRLDLAEAFTRRGIELIDFFVSELTLVSEGLPAPGSEGRGDRSLLPSFPEATPALHRAIHPGGGRPACSHCGSSWEVGEPCSACQAETPRGARFCPACGTPLSRRDRASG